MAAQTPPPPGKRKVSFNPEKTDAPDPALLQSVRATSKPSVLSAKRSNKSKTFLKRSWLRKTFRCGGSKVDSDSSDINNDIDKRIRQNGQSRADEEEIIARLQQAVNELGHRPTSYEIESEIIKWQRMLEIEQKLYEESGKPKFKYKFFRKNRYLHEREHPLYGTNYDMQRKFTWWGLFKGYWSSIKEIVQRNIAPEEERERKIHPEPFIYKRPITHSMVKGRRSIFESRFVAKAHAPSQTNSYPVRSELYQVTEHNMGFVYQAQNIIHKKFLQLLKFKQVQTKWLHALLALLFQRKIDSLPELGRTLMFQFKYNNNKVDIRFLRKTLDQIVNFTFYTAIRKLQRMPISELHSYLADELIMLTTFHTEEYHYRYGELVQTSSSESSSEDENNNGSNNSSPSSCLSTDEEEKVDKFDYEEIHKKVFGVVDKSPQELRTLLTIRLKRGLNLPHDGELSVLKFLRRERAQKERIQSCYTMNDQLPVDHFIPASISKAGKRICYTIFHAVVIHGKNHYALQRLPVPRPSIIRVTQAFINYLPGRSYVEKLSNLVKSKMLRNAKQIVLKRNIHKWPKHKIRRHLWKVSDHVDDDVYDFLDKLLACVVVVIDPKFEELGANREKKMYLTPRTRRKISEHRIIRLLDETINDGHYEITTYNAIAMRQMRVKKWLELLEAPHDLTYHFDSTDSSEESDNGKKDDDVLDVHSSSGSSSSLSPGDASSGEETPVFHAPSLESLVPTGFFTAAHFTTKSKYILSHKKLLQKDKQDLLSRDSTVSLDEEDIQIRMNTRMVKHISAKKWQRSRRDSQFNRQFKYNQQELKLHRVVEQEAERRALLTMPCKSKSLEYLKMGKGHHLKKAVSFQSLRHFFKSEPDFIDIQRDGWQIASKQLARRISEVFKVGSEDIIENEVPIMTYITVGKTLIVDFIGGVGVHKKGLIYAKSSTSQNISEAQLK